MSSRGTLASWNDEKGYGFISTGQGKDRVFVHIKAFDRPSRRPVAGDVVNFSLSTDARGRPCAKDVAISGIRRRARPRHKSLVPDTMAVGFLLAVGAAVLLAAIPTSILMLYLLVSLITFVAYARDKKYSAQTGAWRTREDTLHLLALAGGWPGALIAQNHLRHKSKKQPFRTVFWVTVLANCAAFAWLLTPEGAQAWNDLVYPVEQAIKGFLQ